MKTEIRYIAEYPNHIDVTYTSGKTKTYRKPDLPETAKQFMATAKTVREYDSGRFHTYTNRRF